MQKKCARDKVVGLTGNLQKTNCNFLTSLMLWYNITDIDEIIRSFVP